MVPIWVNYIKKIEEFSENENEIHGLMLNAATESYRKNIMLILIYKY